MKIEIPDDDGTNVISLNVVRESYELKRIRRQCVHIHVTLDTDYATLTCDDCKKELNPIQYIEHLVERWSYIQRMTTRYEELKRLYEAKTRTKCDHCKKMTRVRPVTKLEMVKRRGR